MCNLSLQAKHQSINKEGFSIPDYIEIERRFLVDGRHAQPWRLGVRQHRIEQHYDVGKHLTCESRQLLCGSTHVAILSEEEFQLMKSTTDWTTRLRRLDDDWLLTFKSRISHDSAYELEWRIAERVAEAIMAHGPFPSIKKTRYVWADDEENLWEVDEFEGGLAGLILAEIELEHSDVSLALPPWVGQELTGLASWSNHALAQTLNLQ